MVYDYFRKAKNGLAIIEHIIAASTLHYSYVEEMLTGKETANQLQKALEVLSQTSGGVYEMHQ